MKLIFFLAYNGKAYNGFQKQPHAPTVQAELEKALIKLFPALSSSPSLTTQGAGRTDVGVHSSEQVLAMEISSPILQQVRRITLNKLPRVMNTLLPDDIRIQRAALVRTDENFHPRYRAQVRCYRYRILPASSTSSRQWDIPLLPEDFSMYYLLPFPLDISKLEKYFIPLMGRHDFTSFASWDKPSEKKNHRPQALRTLYRIDIISRGQEVLIDIYGGSFLRAMVRSMIGNVLHHYHKGNPPELIREILQARDPSQAKYRVPAHALFLRRVFFTPIFGNNSD